MGLGPGQLDLMRLGLGLAPTAASAASLLAALPPQVWLPPPAKLEPQPHQPKAQPQLHPQTPPSVAWDDVLARAAPQVCAAKATD